MAMNPASQPLDDVGPSPLVEKIVHGVVWALLIVSIVGIAFIFGLDPAKGFTWDNVSAVVRALGVDLTFYGGIYFARKFWNGKGFGRGIFWFAIASTAAALSWFANSLFVTQQHLVTQDLLNSAGFSWVNAQIVNQVVGAIPIAIILIYCFVPRQQTVDRRTPEQITADAKRELALLQAKSAVEAQKASMAGSRVRGVVGGFINQALNLDEKRQQEALAAQKREARRVRRERLDRMQGLANIHGLDPYADDLEAQLVTLGVWESPPAAANSEAMPSATEAATHQATKAPYSGPLSSYFTATEAARELSKPRRTVTRWMSEDYKGPYKMKCRKIKSKGNARCVPAGEIARIKLLLSGENPPVDTPEEEHAPVALEAMPTLVVSQDEGQMSGLQHGHQNGHMLSQDEGQ